MANRNFASGGKIYSGHVKPVLLDCNFVVDSTNGNGLGIRSLKGPYVQSVYMHTTSTPAAGSPEPSAGVIVVQLQDNYSKAYSGANSIVSPVGSVSGVIVAGNPYVLISAGTATAAQLMAAGLSAAQAAAPAAGMAFIAAESATMAGSATAATPSFSGVNSIEVVGDSNQSIGLAPGLSPFGAQFILACYNDSGALAAPADGSVISLTFLLGDSSVLVGGE